MVVLTRYHWKRWIGHTHKLCKPSREIRKIQMKASEIKLYWKEQREQKESEKSKGGK